MRGWGVALAGAVVVVGVLIQVMINYVAQDPPGWLVSPVRNWLILAVLVLLLVLFAVLSGGPGGDIEPTPVVRFQPRPGAVSEVLRPPTLYQPVRGRDAELKQLRKLYQTASRRFVVLCAVGGMGKTALATEFANRAAIDARAVFWIRYRSAIELAASMEEVAVAAGLRRDTLTQAKRNNDDVIGLVWDHLNRVRGWIVVLDNLDQPEDAAQAGELLQEYRGWVRPCSTGLLLITSRDRHRESWGPAAIRIDLGPLSDEDGARVLCDAAPHAGPFEHARALSARLGGLPLALRAAGSLMAEPTSRHRRFTDYLAALTARAESVLPPRPNVADQNVLRRLVGYTWDLSLSQLAATDIKLAAPMLQVLSLLADAPVPRSLLSAELFTAVTEQGIILGAVDAAVAGLHRYGLIDSPDPGRTLGIGTVSVHPIVRETTATRLYQRGNAEPLREAVDDVLMAAVAQVARVGRNGWDDAELIAPHLLTLNDLYHPAGHGFRSAWATLNTLADVLFSAGRYRTELRLRDTALTAAKHILGPEHPDSLNSRNSLAHTLYVLGRNQEATDLNRGTLAIRERLLGPQHPDTLISRNNLANTLQHSGQYQEAAKLHRENLAVRRRVLGPDHPDTLASLSNLANALHYLGQYQESADLHRPTLVARQRVLGPEHPDTLGSYHNLANALFGLGRYQEAADLHRRELTIRERILGPEHPDTLASYNNLGRVLFRLDRYAEAADLHRETLAVCERVLGLEHPTTLADRHNLANALGGLGRYQEAVDLLTQTLATRERVLGHEHPATLGNRHHLATALYGLRRYQEAADLHRSELAARERILGTEHPDTLSSRHHLAKAISGLGQYEEALDLLTLTLATRERTLGFDHPNTLITRDDIATVLADAAGTRASWWQRWMPSGWR